MLFFIQEEKGIKEVFGISKKTKKYSPLNIYIQDSL